MDSKVINEFALALGFNVENNPACVILMPESFYSDEIDVVNISGATLVDKDLKLSIGDQVMVLHNIPESCLEAILMNCPLVVIDNERQYENLFPISRQNHE
jgi:hypothetical protein